MSEMTPDEALAILMALRSGDEEALALVPVQECLSDTLIHLSDLAAPATPHLMDVSEKCRYDEWTESFLLKTLSLTEMGQYALHLTICISCRTVLSSRGIRPFERGNELLRHVLNEIGTKPRSAG